MWNSRALTWLKKHFSLFFPLRRRGRMLKPFLLLLILSLIVIFYIQGGAELLTFANLKAQLSLIEQRYQSDPVKVIFFFMGSYILITGLSIPGSLILTLLAGAIFEIGLGTLLVCLSGGIGALISFLLARYLLRDFVQRRYRRKSRMLNKNINREGKLYLMTLRLIPVSPYVVINLAMGLTSMGAWTFFWVTVVGMLPGNLIYVYAGQKISTLQTTSEIMTPQILLLLTVLGLLPMIFKRIILWRREKNRSLLERIKLMVPKVR